jgi:hypothetical protein
MFRPIRNIITLYIKNTKGNKMMAALGRNMYRVFKQDIVFKKITFFDDVHMF